MKFTKLSLLTALVLHLAACTPKYYPILSNSARNMVIKDTLAHNPQLDSLLSPYRRKMQVNMGMIIGRSEVTLTHAQPEGTLGNLIVDAQLEAAKKIDGKTILSIVNSGGIRLPFIAKGDIIKGKIYELMPFDNMITIVDVPGSVLLTFCDHMAKRKGWPISGFTYKIKNGKAQDILVNGQSVNPHLIYKIAMSDYIANGGDDCEFLKSCKRANTSIFLRDAIIEKIMRESKDGKGVRPKIENRVSYAE